MEKEVLLNDTDPLWPRIKHMHIADTIEFVLNEFNKFASENKARSEAPLLLLVTCWPQAVGMVRGGVRELKEMAEAIQAMPQYKERAS